MMLAELLIKVINVSSVNNFSLPKIFYSVSTVPERKIFFPPLLKEFVGNRVAMIQEKTEGSQWHHVSGHNNPADLATKGVNLQELIKPDNIWFSGLVFFKKKNIQEAYCMQKKRSVEAEKRKLKGQCHVQNCKAEEFLKVEHFSSFQTLRKRVAFLRRPFCNWLRKKRLTIQPHLRLEVQKERISSNLLNH